MHMNLETSRPMGEHLMRTRFVIAAVLSLLVMRAIPAPAAEGQKDNAKSKSTVAVFRLRGPIVETPAEENFLFRRDALRVAQGPCRADGKGADDEAVKAVVLALDGTAVTLSQAEEIRQSMAAVRSANKDVYLFADGLTMQDFALAAGATRD